MPEITMTGIDIERFPCSFSWTILLVVDAGDSVHNLASYGVSCLKKFARGTSLLPLGGQIVGGLGAVRIYLVRLQGDATLSWVPLPGRPHQLLETETTYPYTVFCNYHVRVNPWSRSHR